MTTEELASLFSKWGDDVYRFAYSYTHSVQDAEDICQSVFLRLAQGKTQLAPGREKAYLMQCTANACRNHLRTFWRRNVGPLEETLPSPPTEDTAVYDAVMGLAPKYRAVVHLYYYEGYSQGEIAQILSVSRTAVQTRMQRAREQLRKELENDDITL